MAEKTFKERMKAGDYLFGFSCPMTVEKDVFKKAVETNNYDFVFTDGQHSPYSDDRLVSFCQLATEFGLPVRFRPMHPRQAYLIGHYLDMGPSGIEVPLVESHETAAEAVENFYYPPLGRRSWGGGARLRVGDFADLRAYADWWNSYGVLWLQIESAWAALHVSSLAQDGVDCFSFGPSDLEFNLEQHADTGLGSVDDCVKFVVGALEGTDVKVSFRIGTRENYQKYADMGVSMFLESMPQV